jgi:hypothetical protein
MEPQFLYFVLQPVWPETAAAHMLVARKQMDRPVLKLVSIHPGDFTVQSLADFFALWKDADPDIPILHQAKAEYSKLK